jgi:hypothetical protein
MSVERLRSLVERHQEALALFERVRDFYGPALVASFVVDPNGSSHFTIDTGGGSGVFARAELRLHDPSERQIEAAVHELLHLEIPIHGFPVFQALKADSQEAADLTKRTIDAVANCAQHILFFGRFQEMGFSPARFLANYLPIPTFASGVRGRLGKTVDIRTEHAERAWWALEYLRGIMAVPIGDAGAKRFANAAEKWGDRTMPGFSALASKLRAWLKAGSFLSPEHYAAGMQELSDLIGLPARELQFVRLRHGGSGCAPSLY